MFWREKKGILAVIDDLVTIDANETENYVKIAPIISVSIYSRRIFGEKKEKCCAIDHLE